MRGNVAHLYPISQPTKGRTLEKVRAQTRLPGHLLEAGREEVMLFHHVLFRFKMALIAEEREEILRDVVVDLHTGWATLSLQEQSLRSFLSTEPPSCRGLGLQLSLQQARRVATDKLHDSMAAEVKAREDLLKLACIAEQKQVAEHYEAMITRLEAGKNRKGADPDRIDAKIQATRVDLQLRARDLEKRYQLGIEVSLTEAALVSYLKTAVPLMVQQRKQSTLGVAVWDPLTREGYFAALPQYDREA